MSLSLPPSFPFILPPFLPSSFLPSFLPNSIPNSWGGPEWGIQGGPCENGSPVVSREWHIPWIEQTSTYLEANGSQFPY